MSEQRRVRFGSIEGLRREDIATAGEVWLEDVCRAPWATREAMKIGAHFVRYMAAPDPGMMRLRSIEAGLQLGPQEVKFALRLLQLYRAIESYAMDGDDLRAALHLTTLQHLKVLEARYRLAELARLMPTATDVSKGRWLPPGGVLEAAEAAVDDAGAASATAPAAVA